MIEDPVTMKQRIKFMLREQDMEQVFFTPFAPGQRIVYYDEDQAV